MVNEKTVEVRLTRAAASLVLELIEAAHDDNTVALRGQDGYQYLGEARETMKR